MEPEITVRHVNPDGSQIHFRFLGLGDWGFCRRLAADPSVRAVSRNQKPPTFWGHAKWMWKWAALRALATTVQVQLYGDATPRGGVAVVIERRVVLTGHYLVGSRPPAPHWGPVGLFRAAVLPGRRLEASIALLPEVRGRGVGTESLALLSRWATEWYGWPLYARIRVTNVGSWRAFSKAGYVAASPAEWDELDDGTTPGTIYVLRWQGEAK